MRRICLLLLTFLFSLQLFAGETESIVAEPVDTMVVMQSDINEPDLSLTDRAGDVAGGSDWQQSDPETAGTSTDLEDQTLPASFAALPLDWHSFPHLYPRVSDGTPVFMLLLRPPPVA